MEHIKFSEFLQKYYKIKLPSGELVTPCLSKREIEIYDKADELGVQPYFMVKSRKGTIFAINPIVEKALSGE